MCLFHHKWVHWHVCPADSIIARGKAQYLQRRRLDDRFEHLQLSTPGEIAAGWQAGLAQLFQFPAQGQPVNLVPLAFGGFFRE